MIWLFALSLKSQAFSKINNMIELKHSYTKTTKKTGGIHDGRKVY
jgi:hypothetical protein